MREKFVQRKLEYKYKQAAELIGTVVTQDHLRELTEKDSKEKSSYHLKYSPREIRLAREKLNPSIFQSLKARELPPLLTCHTSKGGTGKTTVSTNLALALTAQGYRVALIDADPQASATTLMGFQEENPERRTLRDMLIGGMTPDQVAIDFYENADLDFFPADLRMGRLDRELSAARGRDMVFAEYLGAHKAAWRKYEFIIVDTNPSSTILNFNAMMPANLVIAVALLDGLSITALNTLHADMDDIEKIRGRAPSVMLVANGFHPSYAHVKENLDILKTQYGTVLARAVIPSYAGFGRQVRIGVDSRPLVESEPGSTGARAMIELSREISELFNTAAQPQQKVA